MAKSSLPKVPLATFVDFVHASGMKRITIVRKAKYEPYDPRTDFYKPLREAIAEFHRCGASDEKLLTDLPQRQTDEKKRSGYPGLVNAYLKFTRKHAVVWSRIPPKLTWATDDLSVAVNPELAVELDGQATLLKLWFRKDALDRHRVPSVLRLMQQSLVQTLPSIQFTLLDVRRNKLHFSTATKTGVDVLLQGEARAFASMYQAS